MPYILLGEHCFDLYSQELTRYGFTPVAIPSEPRVNQTVASHPDTLIWSHGTVHIANTDYVDRLPEYIRDNFTKTFETPHGAYPTDTVFNALPIGSHLFGRCQSLSQAVRAYADEANLTEINVNQGYARCSTLALTRARAAITADVGMASAMENAGIRVLRIPVGHIALDGCQYGFIGGASFVHEPMNCCSVSRASARVFFFGDISRHPSCGEILAFLSHFGYEAVSLGGPLTDFGGAVILD